MFPNFKICSILHGRVNVMEVLCYTLCLHARSREIPLLKSQNGVYRGTRYFSYLSSKIKAEVLSSTYNLLSEKMLGNVTYFYLKIVRFFLRGKITVFCIGVLTKLFIKKKDQYIDGCMITIRRIRIQIYLLFCIFFIFI